MASLSREVTSEADAYQYLENLRWGDTPVCAHCGSTNVRLIPPTNGVSRRTAGGTMSERRVWKCAECRKQFSVITNTMMHATKVPVRTWLLVILDMISAKNGLAAREVERKYGVAPRTAWHMLHRIRQAMSADFGDLFAGNVVADETYIGGEPRNRHASERPRKIGRGTDKTSVLSLVNADTGEIRSRVIPNITGKTLRRAIAASVNLPVATLHSDSWKGYILVGQSMAAHHSVNHHVGQYVTEKSNGTNKAENYFSQLKRSLDGTHHHVSVEHLHLYLGEFDYRFSTCAMSDNERMRKLAKQMEGRLSYKRLAA
jgi:transposase-like protein